MNIIQISLIFFSFLFPLILGVKGGAFKRNHFLFRGMSTGKLVICGAKKAKWYGLLIEAEDVLHEPSTTTLIGQKAHTGLSCKVQQV